MNIKIYKNKYLIRASLLIILLVILLSILIKKDTYNKDTVKINAYENVKNEVIKIVRSRDPRYAMDILKLKMEKNQIALSNCHDLFHEIGREAFRKYKDFGKSMVYQDHFCTSGYMHGVIEAYFLEAPDKFKAIEEACRNLKPEKFFTWECYHGVGHGLMFYTMNDLDKSLEVCQKFSHKFNRAACSNGVYMENFNADTNLHPSKFLKKDDQFYPCNKYKQYKADCYINAPDYYLRTHDYDYEGAMNWCQNAEKDYISTCYAGVSALATRHNIKKPKFAEQLCNELNSDYKAMCVKGITHMYISYFASLEKGEELCLLLEEANKPACKEAVEFYRTQF